MARNMYAKPTTTNASFIKVPVNLNATEPTNITWGQLAAKLPLLCKDGSLPIKAIKLGAITVGGSPDAPAHLEFKGGQTFDLPAMATKPMRVKASEKNLYVSGWRRISDDNGIKVSSNTDDDDLTNSVVFSYQGQVAYIEVAMRFADDAGYRPWYAGDAPPEGDYVTYYLATANSVRVNGSTQFRLYGYQLLVAYQDSPMFVVGEEYLFTSEAEALTWAQAHTVTQAYVISDLLEGFNSWIQRPGGPVATWVPTGATGTDTFGPYAVVAA